MMKVLYFYVDKGYSYGIRSTRDILKEKGISLECVMLGSREEAKALISTIDLSQWDMILINPKLVYKGLFDLKICVALSIQSDNAFISPHAQLVKKADGVVKSYAYVPRSLHNRHYFRYSFNLLESAGFENDDERQQRNVCKEHPDFSKEDLEKIHVYCGFGSWERMEIILDEHVVDFRKDRSIPVHFGGTTRYGGCPVEGHRKAAVEVCKKAGGMGVNDRSYRRPAYHAQLMDSKAVLSPWGWGEACHRDWEALAKGCVLIKPDTSHVESFPDLTSLSAPYVPCKLDFSDVPEIVRSIESNWRAYEGIRREGYALAEDAVNKEKNAQRLFEILSRIISSK